ncbi:hypothetical protein DFH09DRAFT_1113889 [Mycena vulgaris]|nr:hypothetical protein DFH09DRAFT_1113889 [Mycena vulgaris]
MSFSPIISSTGSIESATPTTNLKESTRRNTLPTGALIAIVIGICSMVSLAVFLLCLKRCRRREPQEAHADVSTTPYPILFADIAAAIPSASNSEAQSVTKIRQQYLRNELRATQEKIIHIQSLEGHTSSTQGTRVGRLLRVFSARGTSDSRSGSRDPEIVIREMAARIRELEAELESPWSWNLNSSSARDYCVLCIILYTELHTSKTQKEPMFGDLGRTRKTAFHISKTAGAAQLPAVNSRQLIHMLLWISPPSSPTSGLMDIVGVVASTLQLIDALVKARDYIQDFHDAPADQQRMLREVAGVKPLQ